MLYVKIMQGEDLPDTNPWHTYVIIQVKDDETMQFVRNEIPEDQVGLLQGERYSLAIKNKDGDVRWHFLRGNAYVMNEAGKTIASHGC